MEAKELFRKRHERNLRQMFEQFELKIKLPFWGLKIVEERKRKKHDRVDCFYKMAEREKERGSTNIKFQLRKSTFRIMVNIFSQLEMKCKFHEFEDNNNS